MSIFEIEGGVPLRGTVRASGNKNAILPMIAACILTDQEVILDNVPDIVDVRHICLLYTSPSPRDRTRSRMPSSA